jgi:hypothetical protein
MDSAGRVMLLAVSALGMFGATVLITAALAGLVANTMALTGVLIFVAFFAFGLGPIPWMIVSEMCVSLSDAVRRSSDASRCRPSAIP